MVAKKEVGAKKPFCGFASAAAERRDAESSAEKGRKFSMDFFSHIEPKWRELLVPKLAGKRGATFLEIGSAEGRSTAWLLDNVLTHPQARVYCLEDFGKKHACNPGQTLRQAFLKNTRAAKDKVVMLDGSVRDQLKRPDVLATAFDAIYVDSAALGDAMGVLEAAVLAWPLLKPGGLFLFDDYTDSKEHDASCPKPAIVSFMNAYARDLKALYIGWMVAVQKRRKTLPIKPCRSEFYHEDLETL